MAERGELATAMDPDGQAVAEGERLPALARIHVAPLVRRGRTRGAIQYLHGAVDVRRSATCLRQRRRRPAEPDVRPESLRDAVRLLEILERFVRREQVE